MQRRYIGFRIESSHRISNRIIKNIHQERTLLVLVSFTVIIIWMMVRGKSYYLVRLPISTFTLLICAANVVSYKDNKSYGTYSNPNTVYSHYWADASNVLDDLTTFRKLYVQYYGCA